MEDPDVEDKAELLRDKCCRNLVKNKRLVATFDTFGPKKYCNCFYDKVVEGPKHTWAIGRGLKDSCMVSYNKWLLTSLSEKNWHILFFLRYVRFKHR